MAKGDIIFEPVRFLIEAVGKFLVKIVAHAISSEPISEWGPSEWLFVFGICALLIASIWMLRRWVSKKRKRSGKRKRS